MADMYKNVINGSYDYAGFQLSGSASNYDVKANQVALFNLIPIATKIFIWSDQNISFAFNSTSYPAIPLNVGDGESPFEGKDILTVTDIFLTNTAGVTANIKILLGR